MGKFVLLEVCDMLFGWACRAVVRHVFFSRMHIFLPTAHIPFWAVITDTKGIRYRHMGKNVYYRLKKRMAWKTKL